MGKKVSPKIFRTGIIKTWPSKWFCVGKKYIKNVEQDTNIRRYLIRELKEAGIDNVEIKRNANKIEINIYTAKPGLIIGRGGAGADDLKKKLHRKFLSNPAGIKSSDISINIFEVDRPNLSAQIIVQSIIIDIEKRVPFRKTMKQAISRIERAGAIGAKIIIGGRLNGAEIARSEMLVTGKLPLQTLRADIDYARGAAHTTYGAIGIKVWIYKGNKFKNDERKEEKGEIVGKNKNKI